MATTTNPKSTQTILLGQTGSVSDILNKQGAGTVADNLDAILRNTPSGAISSAIGDSLYGINHRSTPNAIQINKDFYGLTFFTRPRMNLTSDNVRPVRQLGPLLTNEPASLQRIIRCLLDPQLASGRGGNIYTSPFVDPHQAFIPMLTNHLLSMNGWPDVVAPTHTSQDGAYKEAFSFVDGVTDIYSTYDITANFRNIPGDPITTLSLIWTHYMSHVFRGTMVPYPEHIVENELDYMTRIYRLVLDSSKSRVQKIGACGAAFPINSPIGGAFDFASDRPIHPGNDNQISLTFRCMGAMYQDDILIWEFNKTVETFNTLMSDLNRESNMVKIPTAALVLFNNRGYPHIDTESYELQWWVTQDDYNSIINGVR